MRTDLDDPALIQHHDPVCFLNGRQTVGDDQGRPRLHDALQCKLDQSLILRIERARCFVEQQDRRILEQRARNREPLALAPGQLHATLAEAGLVTGRQALDKLRGLGRLCCCLDVHIAGVAGAVTNVLSHRVGEQRDLLRHQRDPLPNGGDVGALQRHAVEQHLTGVGIVEPQGEVEQRRLAGPRWTDHGDRLARRNVKRNPIKRGHIRPRGIAEPHVAEFQPPTRRYRQGHWIGRRDDLRLHSQQLGKPFGGTGRAAHLSEHFREFGQRTGCEHRIEQELRQRSARDLAPDDRRRAIPHHAGDAGYGEEDNEPGQSGARDDPVVSGFERPLDCDREPARHLALVGERLHGPHR